MNIIYKLFILLLIITSLPVVILIFLSQIVFVGFPAFFKQKRVGKDGKTFILYKFRTMVSDAEKLKGKYLKQNEADGPVFKIRNDPRFTKFGRLLSHTGLDELPQFWNVLRDDMALIGPRPLPIDEEAKLKPWMKEREKIKPGIISPWIFNGYHSGTFEAWMKSDIKYARTKSFKKDLYYSYRAVKLLVGMFLREIGII